MLCFLLRCRLVVFSSAHLLVLAAVLPFLLHQLPGRGPGTAGRWLSAVLVTCWCITSLPVSHTSSCSTSSWGCKATHSWSHKSEQSYVLGTCIPEVAPQALLVCVGLLQKSCSSLQLQAQVSSQEKCEEFQRNVGMLSSVTAAAHGLLHTQPACSLSPHCPILAWTLARTPQSRGC